ncbi:MAG: L,D-transpeptidase [Notoacmeibacter sp.]|nr:L,D-transpeptidase [Notoacmeibacter sp.]
MVSRRELLGGLAGMAGLFVVGDVFGEQVMKDIKDLKPGEFTWHPDRQPKGPVAVVISIPEQRVHVYRNGVRIAVSTCSTGKPGHETPTGVFVVLQKDKYHKSSTYNDAPMPNMNRLTWSGIALHAGKLPGYPASHGCVRLPMQFSELLFTVTHLGTPVIIAGSHSDPWELTHPGMVLGDYAESEFVHAVNALAGKKHPSDWSESESYPVHTVIASSASNEIELIENNEVIARSKLTLSGGPKLGSNVFVLMGAHDGVKGLQWSAVNHHHEAGAAPGAANILTRMKADNSFVAAMTKRLHPGMMLITTDAPLEPDRRSGKDFVIVTS